jgi:peptidyl-prolyl cis-trans isomerase A (cyclophilin A)
MLHIVVNSQVGQFTIALDKDRAPITCAYFSDLVRKGALKQSSIFRVVSETNQRANDPCPIHVVQMGPQHCLTGDRHPVKHEGTDLTGLSHKKWTVSAARIDCGELFGSFFICLRDEPSLDHGGKRQPDGQGFAAFGHVVGGFDAIERAYQSAEPDEWMKKEIPIHSISLQTSGE